MYLPASLSIILIKNWRETAKRRLNSNYTLGVFQASAIRNVMIFSILFFKKNDY